MVALTNVAYDATIAPGAVLSSFGLYGTWITSDAPPSNFAVNGVVCT